MQRIGVFGASFNPPTLGHQDVIEQALPYFDEILLVPSVAHPFQKELLDLNHRLAMLALFVAPWQKSHPGKIKVLNIEAVLQSLHPEQRSIYTYDVLSAIQSLYQQENKAFQISFILGPDNNKPEVWHKFYRYKDIVKKWPLFVAKEQVPIRSTNVRDLFLDPTMRPEQWRTDLNKWVPPVIVDYLLQHRLYQNIASFPEKDQPNVRLGIALFALYEQELCVLLHRDLPSKWSLLTTDIDVLQDVSLEAATKRALKNSCDLEVPYVEQVVTVGDQKQDPLHWSISIIYYALVGADQVSLFPKVKGSYEWVSVNKAIQQLSREEQPLLKDCLQRFKNKSLYTSLPLFLLPQEFTLTEVQHTYEIALEFKLEKKSFRRRLLDANFLAETGHLRRAQHRPAQLYRLANWEPYYFARMIEGIRAP